MRLIDRISAYWRLGPANLVRVAFYRARVKAGTLPVASADRDAPDTLFLAEPLAALPSRPAPVDDWNGAGVAFGHHRFTLTDAPPNWFKDPLSNLVFANPGRPWTKIADFDPTFGDIKRVWELSRWSWLPVMAQQARAGQDRALNRLNAWISDWCRNNPPWHGPNWKCGQEASIRILHAAMSDMLLADTPRPPLPAMQWLLGHSLRRIAPTMAYARAQNNNHGTTEAAGLFIGGDWLGMTGDPRASGWHQQGIRALEERVGALIAADGSFSQHSVTYHRMMLDTLSMCELWRRARKLPPFSDRFYGRARAAAYWLRAMVADPGGDAINLGANDGAMLLPIAGNAYRDFRPSATLALVLFTGQKPFNDAASQQILEWFGLSCATAPMPPPVSALFDDGGYATLRAGTALAVLRFGRFRYRPSQCDVNHLDLWVGGNAILRDGGTYSYNDGDEWIEYFGGVIGHNSAQFDNRPQMRRLGRFLLADWIRSEINPRFDCDGALTAIFAEHSSFGGGKHSRGVVLQPMRLRVEDKLTDFKEMAQLRWRLAPADWQLDGTCVTDGQVSIRVEGGDDLVLAIDEGFESSHYLEKTKVPILTLTVRSAQTVVTHVEWCA